MVYRGIRKYTEEYISPMAVLMHQFCPPLPPRYVEGERKISDRLTQTPTLHRLCKMIHPVFAWLAALFISSSYFAQQCDAFVVSPPFDQMLTTLGRPSPSQRNMISSGFSFNDGEQVLVSLQKPMGVVLEQTEGPIVVTEVSQGGSADRAGVQAGDVLLAVNNASVENADLDEVLAFIGSAARVLNLRFFRAE